MWIDMQLHRLPQHNFLRIIATDDNATIKQAKSLGIQAKDLVVAAFKRLQLQTNILPKKILLMLPSRSLMWYKL